MGQPMHAFDINSIEGKHIIVRRAKNGEKITTLDEEERELNSDDLVIADEKKANKIIEKYNLNVFDVDGVNNEKWGGELGAEWAGATIWDVDKVLSKYPNDKYIIIEDCNDAYWDDESEEDIFDYDFAMNDAIEEITKENGFDDIECAEGEGRNG